VSAGRAHRRSGGRYTPAKRALLFLPEIRDDYPPALKNALAIRNQATRDMQCPNCDSYIEGPPIRAGQISHVAMRHDADCPATNANVLRLLEQHRRSAR
jgi:hypothetical protein